MNPRQLAAYNAGLKAASANQGPGDGAEPVNNKLRTDWNAYVDWLEKKGLKGHSSLDKDDLGLKMIDEYRAANPTTTVSRETVVPIQKQFQVYRQQVLNKIKSGKGAAFQPGTTEENFMKDLSIVDGIPGQKTTSFKFPDAFLTEIDNGKNLGTKNLGFATVQ